MENENIIPGAETQASDVPETQANPSQTPEEVTPAEPAVEEASVEPAVEEASAEPATEEATPVEPTQEAEQPAPAENEKPKKKRKKWWIWLIVIIVVGIMGITCIGGGILALIIGSSASSDDSSSDYDYSDDYDYGYDSDYDYDYDYDYGNNSSYSSYSYISMVKNAEKSSYGITYGDAFEDFFSDTSWRHFTSTDGLEVVEFEGDFSYDGSPATAKIQFVVDVSEGTFTAYYLSIDGVSQSSYMLSALITKAFESASSYSYY